MDSVSTPADEGDGAEAAAAPPVDRLSRADHLSSMALALLQDRERAAEALRAVRDAVSLQTWAVRFGLLADENRLKLLLALHRAPGITVGDLAAAVGMSQNASSQALSSLRIAGVVAADRDGRFRRWSVIDPQIHDLLHAVGASHSALHPAH